MNIVCNGNVWQHSIHSLLLHIIVDSIYFSILLYRSVSCFVGEWHAVVIWGEILQNFIIVVTTSDWMSWLRLLTINSGALWFKRTFGHLVWSCIPQLVYSDITSKIIGAKSISYFYYILEITEGNLFEITLKGASGRDVSSNVQTSAVQ